MNAINVITLIMLLIVVAGIYHSVKEIYNDYRSRDKYIR